MEPMWQAIHIDQSDSQPQASVLRGHFSQFTVTSLSSCFSLPSCQAPSVLTLGYEQKLRDNYLSMSLLVPPAAMLVHARISNDTLDLVGYVVSMFSTWEN